MKPPGGELYLSSTLRFVPHKVEEKFKLLGNCSKDQTVQDDAARLSLRWHNQLPTDDV